MKLEDILVCITNHNCNENAIDLKSKFSKHFESIIIDSKSIEDSNHFDIKLENVYYTGLFNESVAECKRRNKKYLFFIASDVYYDNINNIKDIVLDINDDIYLWAPSTKGQSHEHCKNMNTDGVRDVPYLEGFTFLINIEVCDIIYPVDINLNKFGYGIDILLGYNTIFNYKKRCVVDDRHEVYHKEGTGYDQMKALQDMYNWMMNNFNEDVRNYTVLYSKSPGYKVLLEELKK